MDLDLIGGQKPHLLISSKNNLGAETKVTYAASTKFYLADKAAGQPWITRIPFPVHVVEKVETYDRISRNRFVTRYPTIMATTMGPRESSEALAESINGIRKSLHPSVPAATFQPGITLMQPLMCRLS